MPSLSVYIRQANYEKLRKTAEKNGKTIGQLINKLIGPPKIRRLTNIQVNPARLKTLSLPKRSFHSN